MLTVGTVVAGRYRVEQIIGEGGMGVVAVATHVQLGQQVAIKVLHDEIAHDAMFVTRFLREARASAALRSDHVCRVSDLGTLESGAPYLVMELLDGSDLARVVAHAPLPIATAAEYVLQACIALAEAHAQGIVHRDLKPGNLFLTRSGRIKVLDFGIAKAPKDELVLTRTAHVLGSPRYMSPEQLRSARDVDARTDIWALGVILYELVSQRVPFPAESITELAVKVAVDPPQPLAVDPAFRAVVWRCLEKAADARYANVGALAADLARFTPRGAELVAEIARPPVAVPAAPIVDARATTAASTGRGVDTTAQASAGAMTPATPRASSSRAGWWFAGASAVALAGVVVVVATRHGASAVVVDAPRDVSAPADAAPPPPPVDAEVIARVPADAAPDLREQLRVAYKDKNWDRVVGLGHQLSKHGMLDQEIDELYTRAAYNINDAARPAIEAAISTGECAKAHSLYDAMEKRSSLRDDALAKKLDACKPTGPTEKDVQTALSNRDYGRAITLAEQILAREPGNVGLHELAAMAGCYAKDASVARRHFAKMPDSDKKTSLQSLCEGIGVRVWE